MSDVESLVGGEGSFRSNVYRDPGTMIADFHNRCSGDTIVIGSSISEYHDDLTRPDGEWNVVYASHSEVTWKQNEDDPPSKKQEIDDELLITLKLYKPRTPEERLRHMMCCNGIIGGICNTIGGSQGCVIVANSDSSIYSNTHSAMLGGKRNKINVSRDWTKHHHNVMVGCVDSVITDCDNVTLIGANKRTVKGVTDAVVMTHALVDKLTVEQVVAQNMIVKNLVHTPDDIMHVDDSSDNLKIKHTVKNIIVDNETKSFTITLPETATDGQTITIKDIRHARVPGQPRTSNLTIIPANNHKMEGGNTSTGSTYFANMKGSFVMDTDGGAVTLMFIKKNNTWVITNILAGQILRK